MLGFSSFARAQTRGGDLGRFLMMAFWSFGLVVQTLSSQHCLYLCGRCVDDDDDDDR